MGFQERKGGGLVNCRNPRTKGLDSEVGICVRRKPLPRIGWTLAVSGLLLFRPFPHAEESGFTPLFDGTSLSGWHVSSKTGHSGASKNTSGGRWVIEDGAIVGSQDIP